MNRTCLLLLAIFVFVSCKKNDSERTEVLYPTFSIHPDSVKLNPSGNAPLSALVNFQSPIKGKVRLIVKGKHGDSSDLHHDFTLDDNVHSIPVAGLYGGYANQVIIQVLTSTGQLTEARLTIQTAPLHDSLPASLVVDVAQRSKMEPGMNLVSSFSGGPAQAVMPYMVDSYGDIRWYLDFSKYPGLETMNYECGISRLRNGNFYFAEPSTSKIYEVDLMGTVLNTWYFPPYWFHHDMEEKANGNFLMSVNKAGSVNLNGVPTIEDYIIEIDRKTGQIITEWDLKESLDELRVALTTDANDWMHVNAITEDPNDNTIIVSGRTQGVVKLGYDNSVKWILSNHRGWGKNRRGEDLNQYLLQPLDASGQPITDAALIDGSVAHPDFEWPWFQHSPVVMPDKSVLIFDNGTFRNYDLGQPKYSRAVQYVIDPSAMTVSQKWSYGKERGEQTFSSIISGVGYLPSTKNILFCPGWFVPNANGFGGKVVEIDYATRQPVFQLSINARKSYEFHRVERMPLYPVNL